MKSLIIQTAVCSCTSAVLIAAKHSIPTREERNPEPRRLNHLPTRRPTLRPTSSKPTTSKPTTLKPTFKPSSQKPITKSPTTLKPMTLQLTSTPSVAPTESPSESPSTVAPISASPTTGLPTITKTFSPSTSKPSTKPSSQMSSTSKPTSLSSSSKPSTAKPTSQKPTTFKPLSQRPTSSKPVGSSSQPASWPTARLKIYWQTDFKWQDFTTDPLYCMDCWDNNCVAGDFIKMARCSTAHDQLFSAIDGTIRPALNTSLCFTIMGYGDDLDTDGRTISTPIQLQPCLDNTWNQPVMNQTFLSQPRVGDGFDLIPTNNNRRCLAQLHHPKSGEKVFPRSCVEARIDTTGSWVTY